MLQRNCLLVKLWLIESEECVISNCLLFSNPINKLIFFE